MTDIQPQAPNPLEDTSIYGGAKTPKEDDATSSIEVVDVPSKRDSGDNDEPPIPKAGSRRISLSIRTLLVASGFVVLLAAVGIMTWLYFGERGEVVAKQRQADDDKRAEQIALDYAVNAATMNFQDLNTWKGKLINGTTQSLNDKLTKAATSMEQILVPLEWDSTSQPLVAKVRSHTNGIYVVDTFVSVLTKTTQAPDNLQSTATYSITIDSKNNWQIFDVGGIGAVAPPK